MSDASWDVTRSIAAQALALSVPSWSTLVGPDEDDDVGIPLEVAVEHVTNLFMVRIVAIHSADYRDLSTSTICRQTLMEATPWNIATMMDVITQLRSLVRTILESYQNSLPFHNYQHAHHVTLSANKLMDLMLEEETSLTRHNDHPPCFGLRYDPVALLGLLFAALIHDAEHQGITNKQVVLEQTQYAMLFNDQSVQEQRSLQLAFQLLLSDAYKLLYQTMFVTEDDYFRFRCLVVDAVLATDIANPERAEISKSKWKEAFGDVAAQQQRQQQQDERHARRGSMVSEISSPGVMNNDGNHTRTMNRRGSNLSTASDVSMDSYAMMVKHQQSPYSKPHYGRRLSNESNWSDYDSVAQQQQKKSPNHSPVHRTPSFHAPLKTSSFHKQRRRASNQSIDSQYSDYAADSVMQMRRPRGGGGGGVKARRRASNASVESFDASEYANDSVAMQQQQHPQQRKATRLAPSRRKVSRRWSTQSVNTHGTTSLESLAAESIGLAHKRQDGLALTRERRFQPPYTTRDDDEDDDDGNDALDFEYLDDDDDDDSSWSLTPPSSEDEFDGVVITGIPGYLSGTNQVKGSSKPTLVTVNSSGLSPTNNPAAALRRMPPSRRASTGNLPVRFSSVHNQTIDEDRASDAHALPLDQTSLHGSSHLYKKRLGIRRSMDLSGDRIEAYARGPRRSFDISGGPIEAHARGSIGGQSTFTEMKDNQDCMDYDEPDDLKATVIIELFLRVADVAHNLQSWPTMTKWMSCMYKELKTAHGAGRGFDPRPGWFDNQIKIIETYLMPLAGQLHETGVFGNSKGPMFMETLEDNHDRWMIEGFDLLNKLETETQATN